MKTYIFLLCCSVIPMKLSAQKNDFSKIDGKQIGLSPDFEISSITTGDLNNDDLDEIAFVSTTGEAKIFKNNGPNGYSLLQIELGELISSIHFSDLNTNGFKDILVCTTSENMGNRCFLNEGKFKFTEFSSNLGLANKTKTRSALALNSRESDTPLIHFINDSNDSTKNEQLFTWKKSQYMAYHPWNAIVHKTSTFHTKWDFNNDSIEDLITIKEDGTIRCWENQGSLKFQERSKNIFPRELTEVKYVLTGDITNDGLVDLIVHTNSGNIAFFRNNGNSTFSELTYLYGLDEVCAKQIMVEDINKDGLLDLIQLSKGKKSSFSLLINHNREGFKELESPAKLQSSISMISSFNLDEEPSNEILLIGQNSSITVLKNRQISSLGESKKNMLKASSKKHINERYLAKRNYAHSENSPSNVEQTEVFLRDQRFLGPCLAVADVNGDGLEDFFVGGAHGQSGTLFLQGQNGTIEKINSPAFEQHDNCEDVDALFLDIDRDGDQDLIVASGSNEWKIDSSIYQDRIYYNDGKGNFTNYWNTIPKVHQQSKFIISGDFTGDGLPDFFIGGRTFYKGQYYGGVLYSNKKGTLVIHPFSNFPSLKTIGKISDGEWADVDDDGQPDLILSTEWGSIRMFKNNQGNFTDITEEVGLANHLGLWQTIKVGDFNKDGKLDIIAGNIGSNQPLNNLEKEPIELYSVLTNEGKKLNFVLSKKENGLFFTEPDSSLISKGIQVSSIKKANKKGSGALDIIKKMGTVEMKGRANWHYSTIFLGKESGFIAVPLPSEAQISTPSCILYEDIDYDDQEEILFFGNNLLPTPPFTKQDAGIGLILKFQNQFIVSHSYSDTGLFAYGDIRSASIIEGSNGIKFIVAGTNNGPIRIFQCGVKNL